MIFGLALRLPCLLFVAVFVVPTGVAFALRTFGGSSVREQLSKTSAKYKYIPSRWSLMPPNKQYVRVGLLSHEEEFKTVEKLFRRTMNDYVVIDNIERVQNPFMWEKYCRY